MENLGIPPFLGTTPPISYNMPEPVDIKATSDLKMCLENHDAYETLEGQANREVALKCLHQLLVDWVQIVGNRKRIKSEYLVDGGGVQLRVYGSQRLGVHSPAADIDVLCIAPYFITREDFFTDLCGILREKSKLSDGLSNMYSSSNKKSCNALDDKSFDVSFVTPIPEAYTPVIKFCLNEQSIDMIFVSLTENVCKVPIPPTIDILDIQYVRGLDDKGIRSINGCRVTERILQLVPDVEVFCMALRTIKLWARNRGIYSNVLGFLGGVNYAILVAFICQRYINASPSMIVRTFFKFYCQWRWPHAILLTPIEDKSAQIMGINVDSDKPDDPLAAAIANGAVPSVWNPKTNPRDGTQLMPIITPCYPSMNSAYNVGLPQFRLLQKEIQRGQNIMVRGIISGATPVPVPVFAPASTSGPVPLPVPVPPPPLPQAYPMAPHISPCNPALISAGNSTSAKENSNRPINHWELLLAPATTEFFQRHCRYIQIDISANSPLQQRVWFGWCESRLRSLTTSLEQPPCMYSHPFANCFHRQLAPEPVALDGESKYSSPMKNKQQSDQCIKYTSTFFIGLSFRAGLPHIDIGPALNEFQMRVNCWEERKFGMDLKIEVRDQSTLPPFVFEMDAAPSSLSGCTPAKRTKSGANSLVNTLLKTNSKVNTVGDTDGSDAVEKRGRNYTFEQRQLFHDGSPTRAGVTFETKDSVDMLSCTEGNKCTDEISYLSAQLLDTSIKSTKDLLSCRPVAGGGGFEIFLTDSERDSADVHDFADLLVSNSPPPAHHTDENAMKPETLIEDEVVVKDAVLVDNKPPVSKAQKKRNKKKQ